MTAQSDAERVLLTLVGLADADGRLTLAKTEALDYARVPAPVFERTLVQLVDEGLIEQSGRVDRAARRFIIKARDRRAEGLAYITRNRDAVDRIVAARAQLEPGRASIVGLDGIGVPPPRIVRAEPLAPGKSGQQRFDITVQIPGLGTIYHCVFVPSAASGNGIVFPPSRSKGPTFENLIDWTSDFAESVRAAARTFTGMAPRRTGISAEVEDFNAL